MHAICCDGTGAFYALVALLLAGTPDVMTAYAQLEQAAVDAGTTTMSVLEQRANNEVALGIELARVVQRHVALTHKSAKLL